MLERRLFKRTLSSGTVLLSLGLQTRLRADRRRRQHPYRMTPMATPSHKRS